LEECFKTEGLENSKINISIILTNPENIRKLNNTYRNVDKETDVLSFPMFEKEEIINLKNIEHEETLGDIIISVERVKQQAVEYGHSFERELAYMVVHGFYHLMGEDHIEEDDKKIMREKEENVLSKLSIVRD
jgi:probable rRNA maturation factor